MRLNMDGYCRTRNCFSRADRTKVAQDVNNLNLLLSKYGLKVDNIIEAPSYLTYISNLDIDTKIAQVLKLEKNFGIALNDNNVRVYLDGNKLCIEKRGEDNEIVLDDMWRELDDNKLNLMIGIDNRGKKIMCNLADAPHILVAGSTGSGKSVFLHSNLASLLIAHPNDIELVIIDPKGNEFNQYAPLKNVQYVSNTTDAIQTLKRLVDEMEIRYGKLSQARCRDIDEYNKHDTMIRKVCIVDELADLMLTGGKKVEEYIVRLAQKARACGIHLILATQRPSADVITGLIKTNMPTRVCFNVKSQIDSRIILDEKGGEKLNGKGDMLFQSNGASETIRAKGVYLDEQELQNIRYMTFCVQNNRPIPKESMI